MCPVGREPAQGTRAERSQKAVREPLEGCQVDRVHSIRRCNDALMRLARSRTLSEGNLDQAFREITEVATDTLNVDRASLWLYDDQHTQICCRDLYRRDTRAHEEGLVLREADFPSYFEALTLERSIPVQDAHSDPATSEFSESYLTPLGIGALLDAPIFVAGYMVGVVCNEHVGGPREWTPEEQNFAASMADLAALALESSQRMKVQRQLQETVEQLRQNLRQTRALIDVSRSLISVLDINSVLEKIIELSREVMNAEASSLLLLDPESQRLRFHVARGPSAGALRELSLELGQGIAGWVAQSGEPLLIADAYQDSRFDPAYDQLTGFKTRSILTVPLKAKDQVLGVIQVLNKVGESSFEAHDLSLFQSFGSMGSIALENAQLFARTRSMAEELRQALEEERRLAIEKEKMGAYIPRHVVDEISRNRERKLALGGKTIQATVLFSDIKGFTRLAETMDPQRVVAFLNEYMTTMTEVIEASGGIVDKFMGDGIMAVFLPREGGNRHAVRAVRCGIEMQKGLRSLKQRWLEQRPEVACLQMRCGINTGEMVAGNIGSETRMDYTVIGDNVNVASRIESNAVGGQVHLSESTYLLIQGEIEADRLEPIRVKNRVQPVQVYAIRLAEDGTGGV